MEKINFLEFENYPIEGYLNENKDSNGILIILKEPDCPDGINKIKDAQTNPYFWFYNQVNQKINQNRYCKILSAIVENIFEKELKQCSYINISPFFGKSSETDFYKEYILDPKNWEKDVDNVSEQIWFKSESCVKGKEEECAKKIISNRLKLIKSFVEVHKDKKPTIITVRGIYENLLDLANNKYTEQVLKIEGIKYSVKKTQIKLFDTDVELFKIYHPSYHYCSDENINRVLTRNDWCDVGL